MSINIPPPDDNYRLHLPELAELVNLILRGFERDIRAYPKRKYRLTEWTNSVYLTLRVTGQDRGYDVNCSDGTPGFEEYLCDVLWFNPETFFPDLIVESEWGENADIAYDFEKLLWMKAKLKVMICDPQKCREEMLPKLLEKIRRYPEHGKGDVYLVIDVAGGPTGGKAYPYVWRSPSDGKHLEPKFERLPDDPRFTYVLRADGPTPPWSLNPSLDSGLSDIR
jgi:hypothetical protein